MNTVELNAPIPNLTFQSTDPNLTSFAELKGKGFVLYFYPKDNTPGCTSESKAFRDHYDQFKQLNIEIIGVSRDSLASHQKFAQKHALPFPLIADQDESVCQAFGTLGEKSMFGKTFKGLIRSTFYIDEAGILRQIWRKVKVSGHVNAVLEACIKAHALE